MSITQRVPVTPEVLRWAIRESGFSPEQLAHRVGVSPDELDSWTRGITSPSRGQFHEVADALKRPTALFFLDKPPAQLVTRVSLRAAFGNQKRDLTPDELNSIRYAQGLQTILGWGTDEPLAQQELPETTFEADPESVSASFRSQLGVKPFQQRSWADAGVGFNRWRAALEASHIVVLQLDLGKSAIRGFSLASAETPLAAVNTSYSYQVRIFTLFHEVGHLITNSSSACVGFAAPIRHVNRVERWCELFAASFLLPAANVEAFISQRRPWHDPPGLDEVRALSKAFHVSARAAAMRLIDLGIADGGLYASVDAHWLPFERPDQRGGRAPLTPLKRLRQVGGRVARQIRSGVAHGQISTLDALRYLDLTLGEYDDFSELATAES